MLQILAIFHKKDILKKMLHDELIHDPTVKQIQKKTVYCKGIITFSAQGLPYSNVSYGNAWFEISFKRWTLSESDVATKFRNLAFWSQ